MLVRFLNWVLGSLALIHDALGRRPKLTYGVLLCGFVLGYPVGAFLEIVATGVLRVSMADPPNIYPDAWPILGGIGGVLHTLWWIRRPL